MSNLHETAENSGALSTGRARVGDRDRDRKESELPQQHDGIADGLYTSQTYCTVQGTQFYSLERPLLVLRSRKLL